MIGAKCLISGGQTTRTPTNSENGGPVSLVYMERQLAIAERFNCHLLRHSNDFASHWLQLLHLSSGDLLYKDSPLGLIDGDTE